LAENPQHLAALTADLSPTQLHSAMNRGEWSLNAVLAHLRSCADVWGNCIATILDEDKPVLRAVNPRTWIKRTNYLDLKFRHSLRAFTAQRADLLAVLRSLPPQAWSRSATVTGAGKPLERTLRFYAQWLAKHERSHVKHVNRLVRDGL
jgi:hypothetical protein